MYTRTHIVQETRLGAEGHLLKDGHIIAVEDIDATSLWRVNVCTSRVTKVLF